MTLRIGTHVTTQARPAVTIAGTMAEVLGIDDPVTVAELETTWWEHFTPSPHFGANMASSEGEPVIRFPMRTPAGVIW